MLLVAANVTVAVCPAGRTLRAPALTCACVSLGAIVINAAEAHAGTHVILAVPAVIPLVGGPITLEAIAYGGATALGISAAIMATAPLALALDPHELIAALPRALDRTATAVATALTLIPGLGRTTIAVRDAQRLRGWQPAGPRSWAEIITPVVTGAMERSLQLAESMEARGFGGGRRTRWSPAPFRGRDRAVIGSAAAAVAAHVAGRVSGWSTDWYPFPMLTAPVVAPVSVAAGALLLTPALVWRRR